MTSQEATVREMPWLRHRLADVSAGAGRQAVLPRARGGAEVVALHHRHRAKAAQLPEGRPPD